MPNSDIKPEAATAANADVDEAGPSSGSSSRRGTKDHGPLGSPPPTHPGLTISHSQDGDLFSFLSAMHLSGGAGAQNLPGAPLQLASSRKRKLLEQGLGGHGDLMGGKAGHTSRSMRVQLGRGSDEEAAALHTPQCSQTGYAEEELDAPHGALAAAVAAAAQRKHAAANSVTGGLLSPVNPHLMSEIDLATNFDDSLSGLGVDINTASMSEALLANLPNLSISSSQYFKSDGKMKADPDASDEGTSRNFHSSSMNAKNFGALDLSNDEAHLPESSQTNDSNPVVGPKTFIGSVSRESSRGATPIASGSKLDSETQQRKNSMNHEDSPTSLAKRSNSQKGSRASTGSLKQQLQSSPSTSSKDIAAALNKTAAINNSKVERYERLNETTTDGNKFQYILVASTSIATKISEPSITYLNQGQSYELRLKKLGDLSAHRKKLLRCVMRICFHERRLQYMETEQIAEWKAAHAGERILDFDLPLSYGVVDPARDPVQLNVLSFKWDPTRDTGIFVKVNCISTEFTPKKHGGEKGVPFRLQLETLDPTNEDTRLNAAGCVLQVFKLKGADRKHKQDRDKISKRPQAEQVKFSPSYECTVLNDISIENIYVPPSSGSVSPPAAQDTVSPQTTAVASASASRDTSPRHSARPPSVAQQAATPLLEGSTSDLYSSNGNLNPPPLFEKSTLCAAATPEFVTQWLSKYRYGNHVTTFRNYSGRDLLRLMREELITMCGMSDGIRLYNDLHMVQVAPRTTFYVAQKDTMEYSALFLEDLTVQDLIAKLARSVGVDPSVFGRLFIVGPQGILIRVTDSVVQYTKPETILQFSLRQGASEDSCDVLLEDMTPLLESNQIHHHVGDDGNGHDVNGDGGFHPPMLPVPSHAQQVGSGMMPPPSPLSQQALLQQQLQQQQQLSARNGEGIQLQQQQQLHRDRSELSDS